MDSDEGDRSVASREGTVPLSEWQRVLGSNTPPAAGEMAASSPILPTSYPGDAESRREEQATFEGRGRDFGSPTLGDSMLPPGVVKVNLLSDASSQNSIHGALSSGGLSSAGDGDLQPPIIVGVNPRIINQVASSSSQSVVDREVLVMREAPEVSSLSNPTPLGRQRRLSLFERANSLVPDIFDGRSGRGSVDHSVPPARSDRSNSSPLVKGRNIDSVAIEERLSKDNKSALGRDKYNTVLRDWLMHVVEKDDQHNSEVMYGGHYQRLTRCSIIFYEYVHSTSWCTAGH